MKQIFILIYLSFLLINCNGQNPPKSNKFVNPTDWKGKSWHVGVNRYGETIVKDEHPMEMEFQPYHFIFS